MNKAQHQKELAQKEEAYAIELAQRDEKIAELSALLKTNGIA